MSNYEKAVKEIETLVEDTIFCEAGSGSNPIDIIMMLETSIEAMTVEVESKEYNFAIDEYLNYLSEMKESNYEDEDEETLFLMLRTHVEDLKVNCL